MKGSYKVKVSRRRGTTFEFIVRRNITIVRGDSGTGKTTLYDMVSDYTRLGDNSGVTVQCEHPCVALTDIDWRNQLAGIAGSIVFIDEGMEDLPTEDFARAVRDSDNYYVIFTRSELSYLPYSINEVYKIKTSGKYHSLVPMYKEGEGHRYSLSRAKANKDFDVLLTEDSKSGLQFFEARFNGEKLLCESSQGNSKILNWLCGHEDSSVFVLADGAAFGPYADRVLKYQKEHPHEVTVCLPESFEWLLLSSGVVKADGVEENLASPENYVDSAKYMSWEQFFTSVLSDATKGTPLAYNKGRIAKGYLAPANADRVMALIAFRNVR